MNQELNDLDVVEIDDFSEVAEVSSSEVSESYKSIKEVLEYLLRELDSSQDYTKVVALLNEATIGLTVKCISRVAKILSYLDRVEDVLFNLDVSSQSILSNQEQIAKQAVSVLEVTRKYILLVKDLDISAESSPKRRQLLDLLENLSDADVDKLLILIEEKIN